jgi:hypothetical protein
MDLTTTSRMLAVYAAVRPLTFVPGEDFDPSDEDDVAAVGLAMDRDRADRMAALEAENARLQAEIGRLYTQLDELAPPF